MTDTMYDDAFGVDLSDVLAGEAPADESGAEDVGSAGSESQQEPENAGAENAGGDDGHAGDGGENGAGTPETFELTYLGEKRTVNRAEVVQLAQKGLNHDRLQEQWNGLKAARDELQGWRQANQGAIDEVTAYLKETGGNDIGQVLDELRVSQMQKQGLSEDVARERVARQRAERQLMAGKASQSQAENRRQKAADDIAAFRRAYPDVAVDAALLGRLKDDLAATGNLSSAYMRAENRRLVAELEASKKAAAAAAQNTSNRQRSAGSQKNSGGEVQDDPFLSALFSEV